MTILVNHVSKAYNGKQVLDRFTMQLEEGGVYCLMGLSGIGKTTLLRILMGLELPDAGCIRGMDSVRISAVFQENRLCEFADAVRNIKLAAGRDRLLFRPEEILDGLLEKDAWHRPVRMLSGGMQRRVAVARALAVKSELILMDEPFTGLDEETKQCTIRRILDYRCNRTLLVVTHQEADAAFLGAKVIRMLNQDYEKWR